MCAPRLLGAVSTIFDVSKWAVLAAPNVGQTGAQRAKQSGWGRPCYMYARSLPIRATDPATINSQQWCDALRGHNGRILSIMDSNSIENLCVNTFVSNALWLIYSREEKKQQRDAGRRVHVKKRTREGGSKGVTVATALEDETA